jgi:Phosphoribosyl transferase/TRSP domain C terminus to PRTase_2
MTAVGSSMVERLGVRVRHVDGVDPGELLGLALRRNPRRAQLLVSRVLGKHIPTDPRVVRGAGLRLGRLVGEVLSGPDALVLGYAETATALGHCVAEGLGCVDYLHSTRRPVPGFTPAGGFTEEHSHATDHLLLPADPALLRGGRPLVLVDDELSTGRTALNTITALHPIAPREQYVVAALVDVRGPDNELVEGVHALGARVDVVSLGRAAVELPDDLVERAAALCAEIGQLDRRNRATRAEEAGDSRVKLEWPVGLAVGGRHGFGPAEHRAWDAVLPEVAAALATTAGMRAGDRTLVLGTEELMQLPLRLAEALADAGHDVAFSTTTRSPAVVVDEEGYALRSGITFPAHDEPADGPGPRYAYNVGQERWDQVIVVVDPPADTPLLRTGLLAELAPYTGRTTVVVTPS